MGNTFFHSDETPAPAPAASAQPGKRVWTDEELKDAARELARRGGRKPKKKRQPPILPASEPIPNREAN